MEFLTFEELWKSTRGQFLSIYKISLILFISFYETFKEELDIYIPLSFLNITHKRSKQLSLHKTIGLPVLNNKTLI